MGLMRRYSICRADRDNQITNGELDSLELNQCVDGLFDNSLYEQKVKIDREERHTERIKTFSVGPQPQGVLRKIIRDTILGEASVIGSGGTEIFSHLDGERYSTKGYKGPTLIGQRESSE